MQKGGAEFRFVLWDLGVHVLCLPSLPGEGPSRLCEKLLTGNRADCGEQWGCGLGTLLTLWEQFPGEGQVVSQEGGSCVCLGVAKTWPGSLPWSCQSRQSQGHLSTSDFPVAASCSEFAFSETGCKFFSTLWCGQALQVGRSQSN